MIADLDIGGVLVPGMLLHALLALAGTFAGLRLLAAARLHKVFAAWPLIEIALFAGLFSLLVRCLPTNGIVL